MTLRAPHFGTKASVIATLPDGTRVRGTVFGVEDGRQLGTRFGGPYAGWVYEIVPDGQELLWPRLRVGEEQLEAAE